MKKRLSLLVALVLMFTVVVSSAFAADSFSFKSSAETVLPGETVTVTVYAPDVASSALEFLVNFDANVFEFTSYEANQSVGWIMADGALQSSGTAFKYQAFAMSNVNLTSKTNLVSMTFTVKKSAAAGAYNFTMSNLICDGATVATDLAVTVVVPVNLSKENFELSNTTVTFNGAAQEPTVVPKGIAANGFTVSYATTDGELKDGKPFGAGTYDVKFTGVDPNEGSVTFEDAFVIEKAAATVTAAAKTKVYNEADPALTYTVEPAAFANYVTGSLTRAAGENVGEYDILGTGLTSKNLNITYVGAKFTITKAAQEVKFNVTEVSKTYGDAAFTQTATAKFGAAVTYTSSNPAVATVDANGQVVMLKSGTTTITATVAEGTNWTGATATYVVNVAKAELSVAAPSATISKKDPAPDLETLAAECVVTGLIGDDTATVTLSYATEPDTTVVGEIEILVSVEYDEEKYNLTTTNGLLTIVSKGAPPEIVLPTKPAVSTYKVEVAEAVNGTVTVSATTVKVGDTVTVKVTPAAGYELDALTVTDAKGAVKVSGKGDTYTFVMPNSNVMVTATFTKAAAFADVDKDAYYAKAVEWAVENGITNGMDGKFNPDTACTRAQMVTFLWRAAGSPEPTATTTNFTDVDVNAYYGKAVLWAVENGITNGLTETTFGINEECTRAQMATFMFRMAKGTASATTTGFGDVADGAYYADAVAWAVANGITNGTSDTTFSPDMDCTRGQIVTFLFRYFAK